MVMLLLLEIMNKGKANPRIKVEFVQIIYPLSKDDYGTLVSFLKDTKSIIYKDEVQFKDFEHEMITVPNKCYIIKTDSTNTTDYHVCTELDFITDYVVCN